MNTSNATGHNTAATPQSKIVAVPAVANLPGEPPYLALERMSARRAQVQRLN